MCQEGPRDPVCSLGGLPLVLGRTPPPVLMSRGPGSPGQAARACREGWAAESRPRSCRPRGGGSWRPASEDKEAAAAKPLQCRVQETIQLNRPEPSDCAEVASVGGTLLTHQHPGRKGALGARPAPGSRPPPAGPSAGPTRGRRTASPHPSRAQATCVPVAACSTAAPEPSWSRTGTCHAFRAAEPERPGAAPFGPERPGPLASG